ncbi:MAG: hypothetical protein JXB07_01080, partial [Anaerolineae bacterium]|nr:hypothetical protein [Anaerolineae bacterium]
LPPVLHMTTCYSTSFREEYIQAGLSNAWQWVGWVEDATGLMMPSPLSFLDPTSLFIQRGWPIDLAALAISRALPIV